MALCALPPPVGPLTESYCSSKRSLEESSSFSIKNDMDCPRLEARRPQSEGKVQQLPPFSELLRSIPAVERDISDASSSPQPSAATPSTTATSTTSSSSPRWGSQPIRTGSTRKDSHRASWHPYSPPAHHRRATTTESRSPSPVSDSGDSSGPQPRSARPTYTEEEIYFIWYHRDDRAMTWPQVLELFNMHFGKRERNGVQGIQCRYYRALEIHHVPKSRARDRRLPNEAYGVRQRAPEKWWSWMRS